jgi:hypothetical protein
MYYTEFHTKQKIYVESMGTNLFTPISEVVHYANIYKFHTYSVNFCGQHPYIMYPKRKKNLKTGRFLLRPKVKCGIHYTDFHEIHNWTLILS